MRTLVAKNYGVKPMKDKSVFFLDLVAEETGEKFRVLFMARHNYAQGILKMFGRLTPIKTASDDHEAATSDT